MTQEKTPNIVLIIMDCARADHVSAYGYERRTTPHLDQLAAQGVLYERAFAPATWSLPSHWSLFTGLYLARHGVWNKHLALSPQYKTMAEALREVGYETAAFSNNPYIGIKHGFGRGFAHFEELFRIREERTWLNLAKRATNKLLLNLFKLKIEGAYRTNRAIRTWLTHRPNGDRPFFLFVNYMEPHEPYQPPWPYRSRFVDQRVKQADQNSIANYHVSRGGRTWPERLSQRQVETDIALYDASLAFLDAQLKSLVGFMEQQGLLDNSVLIFTSDHGHSLGEHRSTGHAARWLYDTQAWVPLIMYGPGRLPAGYRVSQQVQLVDLLPTVLALLGRRVEDWSYPLQGHSLLPTDLEKNRRPFSLIQAHYWLEEIAHQDRELMALRTDDYKYIWTPDGADELYNLKQDPAERDNLIDQEPTLVAELQARLWEWQAHNGPLEDESQSYDTLSVELDEEIEERLRALGYIE